jgi:dipeptidyl aminopeptidase/acylaminoacyl peptidase
VILTNTATGRPPRYDPVRIDLTTGEFAPVFPQASSFRLWNCTETHASNSDASAVRVRNLQTGGETEVYRIRRPVTNLGMSNISPDGSVVAFLESVDPDTSVLVTVPVTGGPARELSRAKAPFKLQEIDGHEWSHDGRFVYFLRRPDSRSPYDLYRVPATGGAEERMGLQEMELRGLEISPDGRRLAFTMGAFNRPEIWAMDAFLPPGK